MSPASPKKVSVLMNCFNGEAYVEQSLQSILNQTYPHHEVVFVDNCSTDRTAEIAQSYKGNIKYVRTMKNMPLYEARNVGLPHMDGDYICFLDSDDIWRPTKLERQLNLMEKMDLDFCYSDWRIFYSPAHWNFRARITQFILKLQNFLTQRIRSGSTSFRSVLGNYDINLQTVMIKRSVLQNLNFDSGLNLYGDLDFFFRIFRGKGVLPYYDAVALVDYRVHGSQLSKKSCEDWVKEGEYLLSKYENFLSPSDLHLFKKHFVDFHRYTILLEKGGPLWMALGGKLRFAFLSRRYFIHFLNVLFNIIAKKIRI